MPQNHKNFNKKSTSILKFVKCNKRIIFNEKHCISLAKITTMATDTNSNLISW